MDVLVRQRGTGSGVYVRQVMALFGDERRFQPGIRESNGLSTVYGKVGTNFLTDCPPQHLRTPWESMLGLDSITSAN
jgi:hypothetical protein